MIEDFFYDYFGWIIAAAIVVVIGIILFVVVPRMEAKREYEERLMQECMKERPEYECYGIIKKGGSDKVIPIMMPIPVGR